tara:strand:+ start:320 stop:451 length:132 start_codon:yes stop_codon:yes gene_type:complete
MALVRESSSLWYFGSTSGIIIGINREQFPTFFSAITEARRTLG